MLRKGKDFNQKELLEWEHVFSADFDAELNPIKNMTVMVLGDHGAEFIDMVGTIKNADGFTGLEHGGVNGTINVAI